VSRRSTRTPIELASDIGAKAFDLHAHGDREAVAALSLIARVNPEVLAWLRDRLLDITRQPESLGVAPEPGNMGQM
jgi:hypothetical protein